MIEYLDSIITLLANVVILGVAYGVMSQKVAHLEETIQELKIEVKDHRKLSEDIAVIKAQLTTITEIVTRFINKEMTQ